MHALGHFANRIENMARRLRQAAGFPLEGRISTGEMVDFLKAQGNEIELFVGFEQLGDCGAMNREVSAFSVRVEGRWIIALNGGHPSTRRRVTLMEELAHIWLRHTSTTVSLNPLALEQHRSYNQKHETEAYALAAATLVPFNELYRKALEEKLPLPDIARYYAVSPKLVQYRMQVTYIWRAMKAANGA